MDLNECPKGKEIYCRVCGIFMAKCVKSFNRSDMIRSSYFNGPYAKLIPEIILNGSRMECPGCKHEMYLAVKYGSEAGLL